VDVDPAVPPLLGWQVGPGGQSAYEIRVTATGAAPGSAAVWDCGKVASRDTVAVPYAGPALAGSNDYQWRVRVWDAAGRCRPWSAPGHFGTAPAGGWEGAVPVWAARTGPRPPGARPGGHRSADWAFLRGTVAPDPDRAVCWAHLFATGSSTEPARQFVAKMWVNDTFVGICPTRPVGTETRFDGYDVTDLLAPGGPAVLAVQAYTPADQRFCAHLVIRYADGGTDTFGTGGSWRAVTGAEALPEAGSIGTDYYTAPVESIRSASFPHGFTEPGFDDSAWPAAAVKAPFDELRPTPTAKVRREVKVPVAVRELSPGDYLVDYGRTWIGGLALRLAGVAGQAVDVRYGQVTDGHARVRYQTSAGNTYRDVWTLGDGPRHLETWGLRVFRYVNVLGAEAGLTPSDLTAVAYVYPFGPASGTGPGTFTSSDPALDEIWRFSRDTLEATNLNLLVDSWERERAPYEADAYLQLLGNLATSGDASLGTYSARYLLARRTWPTEWPMYAVLAMYEAYLHTGDPRPLRECYGQLAASLPEAWLDPATGLVRKVTGADGSGSRTDCDIVDWPDTERDGYRFTPYNTVVNAVAHRAYAAMAAVATAVGRTGDAARFAARAAAVRDAVNARMWDPAALTYVDGLTEDLAPVDHRAVHAGAFAVAFGVADDARAAAVADHLLTRGLACSVYAAGFLLEALYAADRGGGAHALLTGTGIRGYLNMIRSGAGATMEAWDVSLKPNTTYSHPWAAAPAWVLPRGMFGIRPTAPGFATFDVRPRPGPLARATVSVPTPRGTVAVAFRTVPDGGHGSGGGGARTEVAVRVPGASSASVALPAGGSGSRTVHLDGVPVTASADRGYLRVDGVPPGDHLLSTSAGTRAWDPFHQGRFRDLP
jgi:hypothetical protein